MKENLLQGGYLENFDFFDDLYLLRFLRARKFDLNKTLLMFTNFLKWRKADNIEEAEKFMFTESNRVKKIYPHCYHNVDKMVKYLI